MKQDYKKIVRKGTTINKIYWNFYKRGIAGLTSSFRVLPDFIIIGSMKSGTTSLYHDICEHPCVSPAAYDEIGFFDRNYELGVNWYRSLFPTKMNKKIGIMKRKFFMTGEDTPFYFWNPIAAKRMKSLLPEIKLIIILRNPIDRAYSEYQDVINIDPTFDEFNKIIKEEINLYKNNLVDISEENFNEYNKRNSFLLRGIYLNQLEIWTKIFSKKQIFILSTENLSSKPVNELESIFSYLELPNYKIENLHNKKQKKYSPMDSGTRKILIEFYKPYNEKLFKCIGKKFDWDR